MRVSGARELLSPVAGVLRRLLCARTPESRRRSDPPARPATIQPFADPAVRAGVRHGHSVPSANYTERPAAPYPSAGPGKTDSAMPLRWLLAGVTLLETKCLCNPPPVSTPSDIPHR
jgi:hypothetical protein